LDLSQIHQGDFPHCLPTGRRYDLIYLSAIDYCFTQRDWIDYLKTVQSLLTPKGSILIISASFDPEIGFARSLVRYLKSSLKEIALSFGLKKNQQFWGFMRTRREYQTEMQLAGFKNIRDGFLPDGAYWISGQSSPN